MAPKRPPRAEDPPAPSSSGEEEIEEEESSPEESSEEEEEGEGEEKKLAATPPPPPPPVDKKAPSSNPVAPSPVKSTPESSSDDEDEEDGSESESESDTPPKNRRSSRAADPTIKPIATKPMEETPKTKKPRSRPGVSVTPSPVKSSSVKPSNAKRPSETGTERKESKRAKKKESELDPEAEAEEEDDGKKAGDESKKHLFQRIWSAEDEIGILKGMIDFSAKHGSAPYPSGDMNEFYDFVNSSLHGDFSRVQLSDKVRRLRKKYTNNLARAKLGEDPTFQKPHEQKAFELSKKIWGGEGNSVGVQQNNRANGKSRKTQRANKAVNDDNKAVNGNVAETVTALSEEPKLENEPQREHLRSHALILSDFTQKNETLGLPSTLHRSIEIGLGLLPEPMKSELKEKQKELEDEEFQLYTKKLELMLMQVRAAMQAYRAHHQ